MTIGSHDNYLYRISNQPQLKQGAKIASTRKKTSLPVRHRFQVNAEGTNLCLGYRDRVRVGFGLLFSVGSLAAAQPSDLESRRCQKPSSMDPEMPAYVIRGPCQTLLRPDHTSCKSTQDVWLIAFSPSELLSSLTHTWLTFQPYNQEVNYVNGSRNLQRDLLPSLFPSLIAWWGRALSTRIKSKKVTQKAVAAARQMAKPEDTSGSARQEIIGHTWILVVRSAAWEAQGVMKGYAGI